MNKRTIIMKANKRLNISEQLQNNKDLERLQALRYIIYVNGAYQGNDAIGRLMHDFSCTNPNDMNYKELAKKARYFKEEKEGVASMSQILEDMRNEVAKETAKATAERMIKIGKMSLDEIATYVPTLSIDELKELEEQVTRV